MSEPQPAMEQAEQNKLIRQIGRAMLGVAPPEWTAVRTEYRCAGRHIEVDVFVSGPDQVPHHVRPPMEVVEGLGRLRQGMYRPGRGTWLSAVYLLEPPSSYNVEYEPDTEPRWRRLPPPIGFQDELRFFPRDDEHIPDWLRHRAGLPPAEPPAGQDQPATPPAGFPAQPGPADPAAPAPPGVPGQPPAPPTDMPQQPGPPAPPPAGMPPQPPPTPPAGMPQQPPAPPAAPPQGPPQPGWAPQHPNPPAWTPPGQNR
jgi:hypothetical protein